MGHGAIGRTARDAGRGRAITHSNRASRPDDEAVGAPGGQALGDREGRVGPHGRALVLGALGLVIASAMGCTGEICDPGVLRDELASASEGDVISLGSCAIEGSFVVPGGVTIEGRGLDRTFMRARGGPALRLAGGPAASPSRIRWLGVRSDDAAAVVVAGGQAAEIWESAIDATKGVAIVARDVARLELADLTLTGPVTTDNARDEPMDRLPDPAATATHGLVCERVGTASLTDVRIHGFSYFGAALVDSDTVIDAVDLSDNLDTGIYVRGGTVSIAGLVVAGTMDASRRLHSHGAVFLDADVQSIDLRVVDGAGVGLMHRGGRIRHERLAALRNREIGAIFQGAQSVVIEGTGTELAENGGGGVVAIDTDHLLIRGISIRDTKRRRIAIDPDNGIGLGDGLQLVRTDADVELRGISLVGNERIGLLVETEADNLDGLLLEGVTVDGRADQLGALAQRGGELLAEPFPTGLSRLGVTTTNDAARRRSLPVLPSLGDEELPAVGELVP